MKFNFRIIFDQNDQIDLLETSFFIISSNLSHMNYNCFLISSAQKKMYE
jgi:hypothetical protein